MGTIETFCDRALWLESGQVRALGQSGEVVRAYIEMQQPEKAEPLPEPAQEPPAVVEPLPPVEIKIAELVESTDDFARLSEPNCIYPAKNILDVTEGTVCAWVRLNRADPNYAAILFHSDDSRYVLYINTFSVDGSGGNVQAFVARAGGNRRAVDPFYGTSEFPEVMAILNPGALPQRLKRFGIELERGAWHHVAMTWQGYPKGSVRLFVDGRMIGEKTYDQRHDNGHNLPTQLAVGIRPPDWVGELVRNEDGTVEDARPDSLISAQQMQVEIKDLRLYRSALGAEELLGLSSDQTVIFSLLP
jgi:hypothetical protein